MRVFIIFLVLSLGSLPLLAQTTWTIDKVHSNVLFTVTHMVISEVTGNFTDFDATLTHSKDDFSDAKLVATVKTASINTANENRDKHLRSADFFDAEKYPEMTFVSKSFEKIEKEKNRFKVSGDLTMRGVTKPVVLEAIYRGQVKDNRGVVKSGFKATGRINRIDFGAKWNRPLEVGGWVVSEEVDITLNVQFAMQTEKETE